MRAQGRSSTTPSQRERPWLGLVLPIATAALMALMALCGCATVNLFERDDYLLTKEGQTIGDFTTKADGIWLSRPAIERLQRAKVLP